MAPVGLAQTDPLSFDPVALGNEWVYLLRGAEDTTAFVRVDAPVEVDSIGKRWVVRRTQAYAFAEPAEYNLASIVWARTEMRLRIRVDVDAANIATLDREGQVGVLYPCRLDLDVSGPCGDGSITFAPEAQVVIGEDTLRTTLQTVVTPTVCWALASGVGVVSFGAEGGGDWDLVYAVVDGDTLGALPESIPHLQTDSIAGWRYNPLAVGDEWHTERGNLGRPDLFTRRRVMREEVVSGRTYLAVEGSRANRGETSWTPSYERLVRYDTLSGYFLSPNGDASGPCPFDEPYTASERDTMVLCSNTDDDDGFYGLYAAYWGGPITWEQINGVVVTSEAYKGFVDVGVSDGVSDGGSGGSHAADIGSIPSSDGICSPLCYSALTYARVRQPDGSVAEIGTVAIDAAASPTTPTLTLQAFPSPTTGPFVLTLDLPDPQPVELVAFDALGRRVWHHELARTSGRQRVEIDASTWAPGLYIVRAVAGDVSSTATVVRR